MVAGHHIEHPDMSHSMYTTMTNTFNMLFDPVL